jgi:hypothetical protein
VGSAWVIFPGKQGFLLFVLCLRPQLIDLLFMEYDFCFGENLSFLFLDVMFEFFFNSAMVVSSNFQKMAVSL